MIKRRKCPAALTEPQLELEFSPPVLHLTELYVRATPMANPQGAQRDAPARPTKISHPQVHVAMATFKPTHINKAASPWVKQDFKGVRIGWERSTYSKPQTVEYHVGER